MTAKPTLPVAIVGGGFAGTMLAANLARRGVASVLIDGSGRIGRGTAYSTDERAHLLNIPAERMSAWPDRPDDFSDQIEAEGGAGHDFVERRRYGVYLASILQAAIDSGFVTTIEAPALRAEQTSSGWRVSTGDGQCVEASALALAIGNQRPQGMRVFAETPDRYIDDPWVASSRRALAEAARDDGTILMIGTGLTMVDCALSLDSAGFGGRIVAMSRRGQLPRASVEGSAPRPSADVETIPFGDLRAMMRWLRGEGARIGWRDAVDGVRPHSHAIWTSLPLDQQRRFMRHARAYWDVHRHRIAPEVARTIARMIGANRLEVMAARISGVERSGEGLTVRYRRRGERSERTMSAALAVNCTGPLHAMSTTRDPLLASLIASGAARPDALDIGLAVDERSRVAGSDRLWALGALTKANYWEIIAVPDIRVQAADVARDIAEELGR